MGAHFDIRLRVGLGSKYYQEFLRLRNHSVEYGVVGAVISLPLGIVVGWLAFVFDGSSLGSIMSVTVAAIYGGLLGLLIDKRHRMNSTSESENLF